MNPSVTVTAQLLDSCLAGDERAITELVARHQPAIYRLTLSVLDDPAEADDATQETFLAALRALPQYRREAAFSTWLYTIALNVARGRLRKRRVRDKLLGTLQALFLVRDSAPPLPEQHALQSDADRTVWTAIQALTEKLRLPLILRYYHELPIADIARILNIGERTVHLRLHDAHERLRLTLKGMADR